MKKTNNKKVVNAVKKFVVGATVKANTLEKEGVKMFKKAEKKWDSTKAERTKIEAKVKKVANSAEKKAGGIIKKTTKMAGDIATGFKQGIKEAKKKTGK